MISCYFAYGYLDGILLLVTQTIQEKAIAASNYLMVRQKKLIWSHSAALVVLLLQKKIPILNSTICPATICQIL